MSALERRFESRLAELHEQTRRTLSRSTGNGDAGNAGSLMWDPDEDEKARARAELERELETLVAVRAMSGADAKRWRERFDAATARDWSLTAADHKLSRRAQKALAELLAEIVPWRASKTDPGPSERFQGALNLAEGIGALTEQESFELWRAGVDATSPGAGAELTPELRHGFIAVSVIQDVELSPEEQARLDAEKEDWSFDPGAPLRVIAGPADRLAGLRVVAVELHEHGLAVTWHLLVPRTPQEWAEQNARPDRDLELFEQLEEEHRPVFEIRDDTGLEHPRARRAGGTSPGGIPRTSGPLVFWGTELHREPVSTAASTLEMRFAGGVFSVDCADP